MLAHNVFFTLHDSSPEAKHHFVEQCYSLLADHPGMVFFAAGTLENDLRRPANDREFDVAIHIVFENMASHLAYEQSPRHLSFIEQNKAAWQEVRVFDSRLPGHNGYVPAAVETPSCSNVACGN
jgi:antibiotic biosynthesis monooxygenase (ABM) superfamily enzyme